MLTEAEMILDRSYNNGSLSHPDGSVTRFHSCSCEFTLHARQEDGSWKQLHSGMLGIDPSAND